MKNDITRIYGQLRYWGLVTNQFDFSTRWLGQCRSYYSCMKARQAQPSSEATLALLARMRRYNEQLRASDTPRTDIHFGQMSRMLEIEADHLAEQLIQRSLQRVGQRHAMQMEMPV